MILLQKNLNIVIQDIKVNSEGRWIILQVIVEDKKVCLVNLYGPNIDDPVYFDTIKETISSSNFLSDYYIVGGDFNVVQNGDKDRKGNNTNYHKQAQKVIREMIDEKDLIDIWRQKYPNLQRFTWHRQNQASRIDYFLISFSLITKVKRCTIEDKIRSDHQLICIQLQMLEYQRGPGYWKFNQKLLNDQIFVESTKKFISEFFAINIESANPIIVWEAFKCAFRGHAIKMSSKRQKVNNLKENDIKKEINMLTLQMDKSECTPELLNKIEEKQKEYENIINDKNDISYYKEKAKWMEKGERCNKFFLDLQKINVSKKNIQKLVKEDTSTITNPVEILQEMESYYKDLFSSNLKLQAGSKHVEEELKTFFPVSNTKLSAECQKMCEGQITKN